MVDYHFIGDDGKSYGPYSTEADAGAWVLVLASGRPWCYSMPR